MHWIFWDSAISHFTAVISVCQQKSILIRMSQEYWPGSRTIPESIYDSMNFSFFTWLQTLQVWSDKLCLQLHWASVFPIDYTLNYCQKILVLFSVMCERNQVPTHSSISLLSEHGVGAVVWQPQPGLLSTRAGEENDIIDIIKLQNQ